MKKKALTMVLAATMLFSMVGCGSTGTADNGSSNNAAAGTENASAAADNGGGSTEGTLTVWCWDSFNVDAMKKAAEIYQKDHPDAQINVVETVSNDIQTLVQTYAMSGELDSLPDIFLMDDQVFTKYLQNYPDVFADLTDSGINFSDFAESKVANSVRDGKNYGVPYDSNTVIACYVPATYIPPAVLLESKFDGTLLVDEIAHICLGETQIVALAYCPGVGI